MEQFPAMFDYQGVVYIYIYNIYIVLYIYIHCILYIILYTVYIIYSIYYILYVYIYIYIYIVYIMYILCIYNVYIYILYILCNIMCIYIYICYIYIYPETNQAHFLTMRRTWRCSERPLISMRKIAIKWSTGWKHSPHQNHFSWIPRSCLVLLFNQLSKSLGYEPTSFQTTWRKTLWLVQ